MRGIVVFVLCFLGIVVAFFLGRRLWGWWNRQKLDYRIGRMCWALGYGTSWIVWIWVRLMLRAGCQKEAEGLIMAAHEAIQSRELGPVEIHRSVLALFFDNLKKQGVSDAHADCIVELLDRESMRRDQDHVMFWAERDRSLEVLQECFQLIAESLGPQ